jgi:hypothetical protein
MILLVSCMLCTYFNIFYYLLTARTHFFILPVLTNLVVM